MLGSFEGDLELRRCTRQNTIDSVNDLDVTDIEDKDDDEQKGKIYKINKELRYLKNQNAQMKLQKKKKNL
ncbi:hypothetical protein BpHYR1_021180 [Brachionus plicatilis]|uniref:Uncharacterized protein n=1 Tax=Brachionus plicatilis TaxID=10195 RepID=A0A3M7SMF0_BRAPC|nr:hypothetical protein BpHYR1_021180 [Brachionus plicatilis]